ncbi:hypothetical protein LO772_26060 [Yinghuangia sp. ASG 101]|uniref:hypothetical protein n=1 Tax=Yinghuangia sp. ASG 101 TaxID=2896848 RepID=UPI001E540E6D|nr:hypothetical protein [Yinghuangia sp. ASG 101]UGQ10306.1 hypothetical protein LO772_26060 [Yinghuangia sp. ASG 101]
MSRNAVAAFIRFVVCGGGIGLLSSGALVLMTDTSLAMSIAVANAIVTVVSTLLCNELHSRITFKRGRASLRAHAESTGTAVIAYVFTTTAMLVLDGVAPHASPLTAQAVYLSASALAGIGRFVVLHLVVFARRPAKGLRVVVPRTPQVPAPTREQLVAAA